MSQKICFVVSAIGPEKSEIRNHSDRIDDKIFDALIKSDLVIVDITGNNPNVFLELGYRKALDLPTIFLRQQTNEDIPFDIRTINIIQYDLKNTSGTDVLESVNKTIQRIQKTEESLDFSTLKKKNNDEKDYVTTQEFAQLKSTINNIYDAIETLNSNIANAPTTNRPMTQEDIIMMAFQEPEKLEKIFELQAKYPNAFTLKTTD